MIEVGSDESTVTPAREFHMKIQGRRLRREMYRRYVEAREENSVGIVVQKWEST